MRFSAEALFTEEEHAEEGRFKKERENAFHGDRLCDDAAGELRESRPVGAELELHWNAGDDAGEEVDAEDSGPEAGGVVIGGVAGAQTKSLQNYNERGKAHGQLRKDVMKRDCKGEVNPVQKKSVIHKAGNSILRPID